MHGSQCRPFVVYWEHNKLFASFNHQVWEMTFSWKCYDLSYHEYNVWCYFNENSRITIKQNTMKRAVAFGIFKKQVRLFVVSNETSYSQKKKRTQDLYCVINCLCIKWHESNTNNWTLSCSKFDRSIWRSTSTSARSQWDPTQINFNNRLFLRKHTEH